MIGRFGGDNQSILQALAEDLHETPPRALERVKLRQLAAHPLPNSPPVPVTMIIAQPGRFRLGVSEAAGINSPESQNVSSRKKQC